jgi:glycosyltransferase involved in cell wall biosynthesis
VRHVDTLVSVGLPVRNGAKRIERVIESVLTQDHENLELVICDNASTDDTEELCRGLARGDSRIVYHRNPMNIGLLNNFISTMQLATGTFFRWVGDDDWLAPSGISRSLESFAADERLILVTSEVKFTGPDGLTQSAAYEGSALGSDDPVTRFCEMLRLLNESYLLIDALYGVFRREPVLRIERRNMLYEDQVFATKVALAGPAAHVPEALVWRNWKQERLSVQARRLDVPSWQAHFATALQCKEMLAWIDKCDLDDKQRRRARLAIAQMYTRRQRIILTRRSHKLGRIAREVASHPLRRHPQSDLSDQTVATPEQRIH